ncbi:MAG: D-alanine--D-alanine ligase [Chloroflexota bacterium]|nr:D-alanine--D-alanine ligase [Chloroflexota bacterium]
MTARDATARDATARDVAVLLGGPSAEHDVSLVSGRAIARALLARGHRVEGWLLDLAGAWWSLPPAAMDPALPFTAYDAPAALGAQGPFSAGAALDALRSRPRAPVCWIALHGPFGEDGAVQALCESVGLAYTGSGVAASAVGMEKALFKRLVGALGMPVVPWLEVRADDHARDPRAALDRLQAFAASVPERRLIVKPAGLGSSVGVSIVHRPDEPSELALALAHAFQYDDSLVAEACLAGPRELEASVVGNGPAHLEVFGPGEVFPGHEFYDYAAKYQQGVSRTTDRPELSGDLRERVRSLAAQAFTAIGAEGFARVDFLLASDQLYLSEINTIPGFTPISLFPTLCAEGGYDFGAIAERIMDLALEREAQRPDRTLSRADLP